MRFFWWKQVVDEPVATPEPSLSKFAQLEGQRLHELQNKPPVVPKDVVDGGRFAANMQHSLFFHLYVEEAVIKAYKRGFQDGKDQTSNKEKKETV